MNLFRSLVMATAAFCSSGTIAGVMTFNPADSAVLKTIISTNTQDPRIQVVNSTIVLPTTPSQIQLGQLNLWRDYGVLEGENPGEFERRYEYTGEISHLSDDVPRQYLIELAGISQFTWPLNTYRNALDQQTLRTEAGTAVWSRFFFAYTQLVLGGYQDQGFGEQTIITFDQVLKFNNRTKPTPWMLGLEVPTQTELLAWLSQTDTTASLLSRLTIEKFNCSLAEPGCSSTAYETAQYSLVQEGKLLWQFKEVSLPTTTSFLLLGFAGLVLRRRLTA